MPKNDIFSMRMTAFLNILRRRASKQQYMTLGDLAHLAGLSTRQVRVYVEALEALRVIEKQAHNVYKINVEILESVLSQYSARSSLGNLVSFIYFSKLKEESEVVYPVTHKVESVLKKMELPLIEGDRLRELLIRISPEKIGLGNRFIGDSFILPNFARRVDLNHSIAGSSAKNRNHFIVLKWLSAITVGCYSACGWRTEYRNGFRDPNRDYLAKKPKIEATLEEEDPFHEYFTEFPSLRQAGRQLAGRYLQEGLHYSLDCQMIEECDKIDFFFHNGTIVSPHGFLVQCKQLIDLKRDVEKIRQEFLKKAKRNGTQVVGVILKPEDSFYSNTVMEYVLNKNPQIPIKDLWLLLGIMRERDATCLIKRGKEKGRNEFDNYYEFYLRNDDWIIRFDFFTDEDPVKVQQQIANVAYSLKVPYPGKSLAIPEPWLFDAPFVAPNVIVFTDVAAYEYLLDLERIILTAIEKGIRAKVEQRVRAS